jgi:hypothetical protein
MSLAKGYIRNIDACLADMADAGTDEVGSYTAWKDLLVWPMFIMAMPTVGAGVILSLLGAPMMWRDACAIAFLVLALVHVLVVVWRRSIFDPKD